MRLHEDKKLFMQAVSATSQQMKLKEIYVEKDYWVTYVLHTIFHSEIGEYTVFKGGTALSKCYNLIERFSEDIDLVIIKNVDETDNQLKKKIRKISKAVSKIIPEIKIDGITSKLGMIRKTAHDYNKYFNDSYGQIRDKIIVEATWLGNSEPYITKPVNSFIYEMMLRTNQKQMALEYGLEPFDVNVLDIKRTICEKIMSLVRFSYGEDPISDLKQKIRHTYDLHKLLQHEEYIKFFNSEDFDNMFLRVAQDDVNSFKNNNKWLIHYPTQALIFAKTEDTWDKIKTAYINDFKLLVYGDFPEESDILDTLKLIKKRIEKVSWNINPNKTR